MTVMPKKDVICGSRKQESARSENPITARRVSPIAAARFVPTK